MPRVAVSTTLDAPVEEVWDLIRDFGAIDRWFPGLQEGDITIEEDRPGDCVGVVRSGSPPDADVPAREKLIAFSDREHFHRYTILQYPEPLKVENYDAMLKLDPITEGNRTFVRWSTRYDIDDERREETVQYLREVFGLGLEALKERFAD